MSQNHIDIVVFKYFKHVEYCKILIYDYAIFSKNFLKNNTLYIKIKKLFFTYDYIKQIVLILVCSIYHKKCIFRSNVN